MSTINHCKYCGETTENVLVDKLQCLICNEYVHSRCLKRGDVPGCLAGDIFYKYKCAECTLDGSELFARDKMPWLQVITLVLYHMNTHKKALAKKGFFHWKIHIAAFIDHNWNILFKSDMKKKKNWIGTISGTLSHYSPIFFVSGTSVLKEQGWWMLTYPKLPPSIIIEINEDLMLEKQKCREAKISFDGVQKVAQILQSKPYASEAMLKSYDLQTENLPADKSSTCDIFETQFNIIKRPLLKRRKMKRIANSHRKTLLPTVQNILTQYKQKNIAEGIREDIPSSNESKPFNVKALISNLSSNYKNVTEKSEEKPPEIPRYLNRFCYYNTSLNDATRLKLSEKQLRLIGTVYNNFILSPYSSSCLSPFIWRSESINPPWLQLMDEVKFKVNRKLVNRTTLDFAYIQPNHIPALNSLCHQFFWKGINLTDTLQYPEYTCVVLHKKLVVGFACIVPNVATDEVYLSFIFTRPGWRKCGIAKFMLYHLIQVVGDKNITLHVSTSNPALILFQRFGFKIQYLEKSFYQKYLSNDSTISDAFFCKLSVQYIR